MSRALIVLLIGVTGCAYHLGPPDVTYGIAEPVPLVQPSSDGRRWYIPVESETLGPQLFFLDTGYSYTTCDDALVAGLDLNTRGKVAVRGELGRLSTTKAILPPLVLGGHTIEGLTCQVRDIGGTSSINDPREVPVAGVLGIDVLRRFHVIFDPATGHVELHEPRALEPLPKDDPHVVRLKRENLIGIRTLVPITIADQTLWPILDTGTSDTYIDGRWIGLAPTWHQEGVTVRGTGLTSSEVRTMSYYDVGDLQVAGLDHLGDITLTERQRGRFVPGLVGLNVLRSYRQEYDFKHNRARFTAVNAVTLPTWFAWSRLEDAARPGRLEDGSRISRR